MVRKAQDQNRKAYVAEANRVLFALRKWPAFRGWKKKDVLKAYSRHLKKPKPGKKEYEAIYLAMRDFAAMHGIRVPAFKPKQKKPAASPSLRRTDYGDNATFTQWRLLRYQALRRAGGRCECCGATPQSSGEPLHVDHIKPKSIHPDLALELSNLQVLCADCNIGKGNWDETNWRAMREEERATAELDAKCIRDAMDRLG